MAYTALARKYRSRTFDEVVGQEPIATTLANAIKADRIHHGYLFTGTRGVGKTSMARILAKALNCLKADAPTATPCCACDACLAIGEGQDVDVLEIDAASNTGVDNIRELRSNTAYRPARSRFKVYIIDEVHMLSTGAFNALLKTLEEPPEHVKFILATTELQKVPATIQSRCQRFNFRNIGPEQIAGRLREIITAEGATADEIVVQRVSRLARGSMRDALSILDQLLSVAPTQLDAKLLDDLLPPAQDERVFALLEHCAAGDVKAVLNGLDELVAAGRGLDNFCNDAVEVVRALLVVKTCGADATLVDIPAGAAAAYQKLAEQFELSHYVQMIAMLEELRRNVRYSTAGRALAEAVLVRMAHMRAWGAIEQLLGQTAGTEKKKPLAPPASPPKPASPPTAGSNGSHGAAQQTPPGETRSHQPRTADVLTQRSVPAREVQPPPSPPARPEPAPDDANDVPPDYHPVEAEVSAQVRQSTAPQWREATGDERKRALADQTVKQALDLFDGSLIEVRMRANKAAADDPDETDLNDETEAE